MRKHLHSKVHTVTGQTDYIDDDIADVIINGSKYERLRVRRHSIFDQSIPTKLAWQSVLLLALALVAPITLVYPSDVAALYPGGDPLTSSPTVLMPGALVLILELGTAVAHVAVAGSILRGGSALSERRMRNLLSVEEMASFYGFVGGVLLLGITLGFFLFGFSGVETIQQYSTTGQKGPFDPSGTGLSVATVSLFSFVASGVLFVVSRYLDTRL
ncbi:hypothetical protein [Haladaptatus caseinilyticus]|uniref:hypothetical protein n=1 Tax=Haladaptatus caseinilyticus TaxID=2993314 RepID=UPI00224A95FA|nr:hypothetical protein [Haladaptatus caseinilyticus]